MKDFLRRENYLSPELSEASVGRLVYSLLIGYKVGFIEHLLLGAITDFENQLDPEYGTSPLKDLMYEDHGYI